MSRGFAHIAACTLPVHLGNIRDNQQEILDQMEQLAAAEAQAAVFPELCLTGATLGDLFLQRDFLDCCMDALRSIAYKTGDMAVVVGLPVAARGRVYNCAAVVKNRRVWGLIPKTCLTNEEMRWFTSGEGVCETVKIDMGATKDQVELNPDLLFDLEDFTFGVSVGQDLWSPDPRAGRMALNGAEIILNPCAVSAQFDRNAYLPEMYKQLSRRLHAAIACVNAGMGESTADMVFDGWKYLFDDGRMLAKGTPYQTGFICECVDTERLLYQRQRDGMFFRTPCSQRMEIKRIGTPLHPQSGIPCGLDRLPFVPKQPEQLEEIFEIQCRGLYSRLQAIGNPRLVVGISGGLDSTLALLVAARAMDMSCLSRDRIIAITMPGMGTGARTKTNADKLMQALGVTRLEIPIGPAVKQHFADIGHPEDQHDVTYENSQARERTQILMDYANKAGGIVLGTGDLSEGALGFCTYNGDHMSMYNVNCGIPKTLVRRLTEYMCDSFGSEVAAICRDVVSTPISPELLPVTEGELNQRTEDILGDYELLDFFLYHYLDSGAASDKLYLLASHTFSGVYSEAAISKALSTFWRKFHNQQFKRNCVPDGPQVSSFTLSPRGGWHMPSDLQGW